MHLSPKGLVLSFRARPEALLMSGPNSTATMLSPGALEYFQSLVVQDKEKKDSFHAFLERSELSHGLGGPFFLGLLTLPVVSGTTNG